MNGPGSGILVPINVYSQSHPEIYVEALFLVSTTISTIGYGTLSIIQEQDRMFMIFLMFTGILV